jgi:hypothetical protein
MFEIQRLHRLTVAAAAVLVAAGCAKSDEGTTDTAGGTTAAATPTDTGAAGMDHSTMPGMNRPPAKDGDHEFLRGTDPDGHRGDDQGQHPGCSG